MLMNIIEFCSKLFIVYFFCCYCLYCVNFSKIWEIELWFNNIYVLCLCDLEFQVLVSCSKVKEFCQLMNLQRVESIVIWVMMVVWEKNV